MAANSCIKKHISEKLIWKNFKADIELVQYHESAMMNTLVHTYSCVPSNGRVCTFNNMSLSVVGRIMYPSSLKRRLHQDPWNLHVTWHGGVKVAHQLTLKEGNYLGLFNGPSAITESLRVDRKEEESGKEMWQWSSAREMQRHWRRNGRKEAVNLSCKRLWKLENARRQMKDWSPDPYQTSTLQDCKIINFCNLSHKVYSNLINI